MGGGARRLAAKRHEGTSWDDRNVLYLDLGGSYMGVNRCQNPWNCTL